jgi:hypothetical protein
VSNENKLVPVEVQLFAPESAAEAIVESDMVRFAILIVPMSQEQSFADAVAQAQEDGTLHGTTRVLTNSANSAWNTGHIIVDQVAQGFAWIQASLTGETITRMFKKYKW